MNPDDIYFISDTHFYHNGVLKYSNRPFANVEEMNEALINNWNSKISSRSHIFHLGDLTFGNRANTELVLSKLNGQKYLILGNHDRGMNRFKHHFIWIKDYHEMTVMDLCHQQKIILFHYPIGSWNKCHYGSWQLHGHCHGNFMHTRGKQLDVGVDALPGYRPYSYREISEIMTQKSWQIVDHHCPQELTELIK